MMAVLQVLVTILKVIGITVLVLLGLVLFLVLLALLAPVRYRGKVEKQEEPEEILSATGLVSWLNPILRLRVQYKEKKFCYTVRVFGVCIKDSEKPKKEKKKKEKRKKRDRKEKKKKREEAVDGTGITQNGTEVAQAEVPAEPVVTPSEPVSEQVTEDVSAPSGEENGKEPFLAKLKKLLEKIKSFPGKIKEKAEHLYHTIKLLWYKKEKVIAFLQDELHKTALGTAWKDIKKLLRHILPGKIKGHVEFGTGEPESTGKALAVLGILYGAYGKGVTIVPDFYEKRLIAKLGIKGRIRLGTVLVIVLHLIRDKQVKRLIKNWKKLVKILKQKAE